MSRISFSQAARRAKPSPAGIEQRSSRLLRQIENGAERARRRGELAVDVARLRDELGLGDELAA